MFGRVSVTHEAVAEYRVDKVLYIDGSMQSVIDAPYFIMCVHGLGLDEAITRSKWEKGNVFEVSFDRVYLSEAPDVLVRLVGQFMVLDFDDDLIRVWFKLAHAVHDSPIF